MRLLALRVEDYKNDRWAVILDAGKRWLAAAPQVDADAGGYRDEGFDTHTEAIAYADKEARK